MAYFFQHMHEPSASTVSMQTFFLNPPRLHRSPSKNKLIQYFSRNKHPINLPIHRQWRWIRILQSKPTQSIDIILVPLKSAHHSVMQHTSVQKFTSEWFSSNLGFRPRGTAWIRFSSPSASPAYGRNLIELTSHPPTRPPTPNSNTHSTERAKFNLRDNFVFRIMLFSPIPGWNALPTVLFANEPKQYNAHSELIACVNPVIGGRAHNIHSDWWPTNHCIRKSFRQSFTSKQFHRRGLHPKQWFNFIRCRFQPQQ